MNIEAIHKELKISDTLLALMRSCKRNADYSPTIDNVKKVLGPLYHYDMKYTDVLRVMLKCYLELLADPRFEAGHTRMDDVIFELLTMPTEVLCREKGYFKPFSDLDSLSLKQIYEGFIEKMMSAIHLSNVGWCRHLLWPEESLQNKESL